MSVVALSELFEGRSGSFSATEGRRYVRVFRAITDSPFDGPQTVMATLGIHYGDAYQGLGLADYEVDPTAYVVSIEPVQEEGDSLGWTITVTYDWFSSNFAGGGPTANPLLIPIEVTWSYRNQEKVAQYDANSNAIVNTAGDPFDPPIVIDDPRPMMTVVRNEPTFNVSLNYQYRNAVNSDQFAGYAPQMARMIQMSGRYHFHQIVGWYSIVTYEIEFNPPNGYRPLILNQGLRQLSTFTGLPIPITLNGLPISQPMLLTSGGYLAKPNVPPYFIQPQVYPELPFAVFGFDTVAVSGQRSGFNTSYQGSNPGSGGS